MGSPPLPLLQLRFAIGQIGNPLVRDIADSYTQFISEINRMQNLLGILHDNVLVVDDMVGGLVSFDLGIDKMQQKHYEALFSLRSNLQALFFCGFEMVRTLEESLQCLIALDHERKHAFAALSHVSNRLLEIHHQISQKSAVKELVQKLFILENMFKRMVKKWIIFGNNASADLSVLEVIERVLSERHHKIRGGDMYGHGNENLIRGIERQLGGLKKLTATVNREQLRVADAVEKILKQWSNYHKENAMDPNFYAVFTSDGTFDKLVRDYAKVDRALRIEVDNLNRELMFLSNRDKAVAQVLAIARPGLDNIVAQKNNLNMMTKLGTAEVSLMFNEVEQCINKSGGDLDECLKELSGVKSDSVGKIRSYIDFATIKGQILGKQAKYAEILLKLHSHLADAERRKALRGIQSQAGAYEVKLMRLKGLKDEVQEAIKDLVGDKREVYEGLLRALEDSTKLAGNPEKIKEEREFIKKQAQYSETRAVEAMMGGAKMIMGGGLKTLVDFYGDLIRRERDDKLVNEFVFQLNLQLNENESCKGKLKKPFDGSGFDFKGEDFKVDVLDVLNNGGNYGLINNTGTAETTANPLRLTYKRGGKDVVVASHFVTNAGANPTIQLEGGVVQFLNIALSNVFGVVDEGLRAKLLDLAIDGDFKSGVNIAGAAPTDIPKANLEAADNGIAIGLNDGYDATVDATVIKQAYQDLVKTCIPVGGKHVNIINAILGRLTPPNDYKEQVRKQKDIIHAGSFAGGVVNRYVVFPADDAEREGDFARGLDIILGLLMTHAVRAMALKDMKKLEELCKMLEDPKRFAFGFQRVREKLEMTANPNTPVLIGGALVAINRQVNALQMLRSATRHRFITGNNGTNAAIAAHGRTNLDANPADLNAMLTLVPESLDAWDNAKHTGVMAVADADSIRFISRANAGTNTIADDATAELIVAQALRNHLRRDGPLATAVNNLVGAAAATPVLQNAVQAAYDGLPDELRAIFDIDGATKVLDLNDETTRYLLGVLNAIATPTDTTGGLVFLGSAKREISNVYSGGSSLSMFGGYNPMDHLKSIESVAKLNSIKHQVMHFLQRMVEADRDLSDTQRKLKMDSYRESIERSSRLAVNLAITAGNKRLREVAGNFAKGLMRRLEDEEYELRSDLLCAVDALRRSMLRDIDRNYARIKGGIETLKEDLTKEDKRNLFSKEFDEKYTLRFNDMAQVKAVMDLLSFLGSKKPKEIEVFKKSHMAHEISDVMLHVAELKDEIKNILDYVKDLLPEIQFQMGMIAYDNMASNAAISTNTIRTRLAKERADLLDKPIAEYEQLLMSAEKYKHEKCAERIKRKIESFKKIRSEPYPVLKNSSVAKLRTTTLPDIKTSVLNALELKTHAVLPEYILRLKDLSGKEEFKQEDVEQMARIMQGSVGVLDNVRKANGMIRDLFDKVLCIYSKANMMTALNFIMTSAATDACGVFKDYTDCGTFLPKLLAHLDNEASKYGLADFNQVVTESNNIINDVSTWYLETGKDPSMRGFYKTLLLDLELPTDAKVRSILNLYGAGNLETYGGLISAGGKRRSRRKKSRRRRKSRR